MFDVRNASDSELEEEYERLRQEWLADDQPGYPNKTPEMERISQEMTRRAEIAWANDPRRNTDPDFRWSDSNRWE